MTTFGERFRRAMKRAELPIRAFHREIESRGVKGCSYQAVHRYLKNKGTPSFEFLETTAEILNVRVAWLAFGDGAPEPQEDIVLPEPEQLLAKRLGVNRLEQAEPRIPDQAIKALNVAIGRAAMYIHERDKTPLQTPSVAQQMMGLIAGTFESLGIEPDELPPRAYAQYVMAIIHALDLAIPYTRQDLLQS